MIILAGNPGTYNLSRDHSSLANANEGQLTVGDHALDSSHRHATQLSRYFFKIPEQHQVFSSAPSCSAGLRLLLPDSVFKATIPNRVFVFFGADFFKVADY